MFEWDPFQLAFLALVFLSVLTLTVGASRLMRRGNVERRLRAVADPTPSAVGHRDAAEARWLESFVRLTRPLADLALPDEGWEESELRRRFMNAGIRTASASRVFFVLKTILAVLVPLAFVLLKVALLPKLGTQQTVFAMAVASAIGYCIPNYLLGRRIEARRRQIVEHFPDALDLLTISVEAGLGLDAGLYRVASELALNSPALADELTLVSLELRAGAGRERALRNLATRTGVEDIESLVAMMIQSDRFGTGVADALRVHSDQLRSKRQQRAEQEAAKLSNRLLFPLMLCIFPAILIVVAAPAAIQISKTLPSIGAKAR